MFNLANYETVEERLSRFWDDHATGRINTQMVHYDDNKVVFRAEVYFDAKDTEYRASGYAEEVRGASPVNKTSHVENCETSAIGRALANCGYAPKGARPSREEMEKASRQNHPTAAVKPANQPTAPKPAAGKPAGATISPITGYRITPAQRTLVEKLAKERNIDDLPEFLSAVLNRDVSSVDDLEKRDASAVIKSLLEEQRVD